MLSLLEKEQTLADTLKKAEEAMQLVPMDGRASKRAGTLEYLQTVKTRVGIELLEVNNQRIATFNKIPFTSRV